MVAIIEELFFRSFILQIMLKYYQKKGVRADILVILLNSVMFAFMHIFNLFLQIETIGYIGVFQSYLIISLLGILLAVSYYLYDNVIVCIYIHMGFNIISSLAIGNNPVIYILLYMILLAFIIFWLKIMNVKKIEN
ncbi:CPBP family intramembrane glutamic endopeptidase [[Clostridium] polysaccharolyticum]|uniref:CPBP family intramembrane glutamic endopeptidase n=1 Tax=[Clostridium] polysaccharolyticum TaxID=29364 RepID=UPI000B83D7E3